MTFKPRYTPRTAEYWMRKLVRRCRVEKRCMIWEGPTNKGYGRVYHRGQQVPVHRFAYELKNGILLPDTRLQNQCGHVLCINPKHWIPR